MTDRSTMEERENGPLVFKGVTRMTDHERNEIEVKPVMALCRCGGSDTKPFCSGKHRTNGFQSRGGEPAGKDKILRYEGAQATVLYNPRVCSHAAQCARASSKAFDSSRRPWIDPDADAMEAVETAVRNCPSGALRIEGRDDLLPDRAEIVVEKNGPYWVLGVEMPGEAGLPGEGATPRKLALCRCGLSGNKPFCDGSHKDKGWKAT